MISVYVFGKIESGRDEQVLDTLKGINQVRRVSLTFGIYDLCIEALFSNLEELNEVVFNVIRKIPGIKETTTIVTSRSIHPPMDF